jgi:hypothetical protein
MPLFVKILPRLSDGSGTATFAEQIAGPASSLTKEPLRQRGVARGAEDVWAAGVGPECRQSGRPTCALLQRDSYRQAEDPFVVSLCRSPGTKSDGPSLLAESASRRPPLSYLFRGPSPRKPRRSVGAAPLPGQAEFVPRAFTIAPIYFSFIRLVAWWATASCGHVRWRGVSPRSVGRCQHAAAAFARAHGGSRGRITCEALAPVSEPTCAPTACAKRHKAVQVWP